MRTLCLLLVLLVTLPALCADKNYAVVEGATHRIQIRDIYEPDGAAHCSGTAVGHHILLTAGHCDHNSNVALVDGVPIAIFMTINDGHDHLLVFMPDADFKKYVPLTQRPFVVSEDIFIVGNPMNLIRLYRRGVVAGESYYDDEGEDGATLPRPHSTKTIVGHILDLNGFFGDSGAGIFSDDGHLIGVLSSRKTVAQGKTDQTTFMVAFDLSFTKEQLSMVEGH